VSVHALASAYSKSPIPAPVFSRQLLFSPLIVRADNFIDLRATAMLPITSSFGLALYGRSTVTNKVEVTLESQLDSVSLAEEMCTRIAAAAGFDDDDCFKIGMSVREGVINAYNYGSQKQPGKKIFLTFELTAEKLIVRVQDQGKGFRLEDVPDPLADENLLKSSQHRSQSGD